MAKLAVKPGSTSQTFYVFIRDTSVTTGAGLTGLVYNSGSLVCYYVRPLGSATSVTLATLAAATSAWSSGGFKEVDATNMPGIYRFDCPDAVIATGVRSAVVMLKGAANMEAVVLEFDLSNDANVEYWKGTAAAAVDTAGYPKVTIKSGTGTGEVNLSSGRADANTLYWNGTAVATPDTAGYPKVTHKSGTGTGELNITSGVVDANVTKFGGTAGTFASGIPASSLTTAAINAAADQVWDEASSGHVAAGSYGAQLQAPSSGTAQAGAATTITFIAGASAVTDFYKNDLVVIIGGTGVGQARFVTAYNGTTKVATVSTWATNPDNTSVYTTIPFDAIPGATAPTATQNADAVWGALLSSYVTTNTMGGWVNGQVIRRNTAQSGTTGSITLDASASATNDLYKYSFVKIVSGTGANQQRQITGYTGASKVAAVAPAFTVAPDNTSVFEINPFGLDAATVAAIAAAVWEETRAAHTTAGTVGEYTNASAVRINGNATAAANAQSFFDGTGYAGTNNTIPTVTSVSGNVGGNVTGSVGALAAQAKTDVGAATWGAVRATYAAAGSFGEGVASVQGNITGSVASVTGNVGGNVVGSVASVTGNVGGNVVGSVASVTGNVGGNVTGDITGLTKTGFRLSSTGVNDILDGALTEPAAVFAWGSATLRNVVAYMGAKAANKQSETLTVYTLRNRADSATIATSSNSDDGTTTVKGSDT